MTPFVLIDDARTGGGGAQLYAEPLGLIRADRPGEVAGALDAARAALTAGEHVAGYLAYEAGHALEPRLAPLAAGRVGADGPLVWFGRFGPPRAMGSDAVASWLAERDAGNAGGATRLGPLDPGSDPADYRRRFDAVQAAIAAGDIYQANLAIRASGSFAGDPHALYARLRDAAAAGHGALVFDGSHWLLSLSPELFFAVADGRLVTRPMKGTAARHPDADADRAARLDLAADAKNRAENLMIVDLMRNDCARVAQAGSVSVPQLFAVESYPTVHQMVSQVEAALAPGRDALDVLGALFPCGSITGAPKIRAMEVIGAQEAAPRGPYCGAIGAMAPDGAAAFSVAIRTLRLDAENGRATMGLGSAVIADSDADAEWRECQLKGRFAREAAPGFDLVETMRFEPAEGIRHLELHLSRMKESARAFGFSFDRHAARNALHAACFHADAPARVRLVLAAGGATAIELSPLPAAMPDPVPCLAALLRVDPLDLRLAHKTTDRGFYDEARGEAQAAGAAEAVLVRPDGLVTEGSFTSVFVERSGQLVTPPLALGLLPGILRASLLEEGRAVEGELRLADLAGGFLIGNALRGLMPAHLVAGGGTPT